MFIVEAIHPTEPKGGFDTRIGPGFRGTVGESDDGPPYAPAKEREQLRADFEAGVIPFYEYEFSSGKVFHNGIEVYAGINALEAAMDIIDAKFPGALG